MTDADPAARDALALAERALPSFGFTSDARLTFVKLRENAVFRVDDGDDAAVLRVHRAGYRTDGEIASELAFVRELRAGGGAVPGPRPATDGADFVVLTGPDGDVQVDVLEWMHGTTPLGDCFDAQAGDEEVEPVRFSDLGAALGELHAISRRAGRPVAFDRRPWDRDGLVGPAPLWGDPTRLPGLDGGAVETLRAAAGRIGEVLDAAGTGPERYGVIHADATPENVLVDAEGTLTLIDFDDFGEGWYLFDLATPLFWYSSHPRFDEVAGALLSGYARTQPLGHDDAELLAALVVARGTTYLGWAADRPGTEVADHLEGVIADHVLDHCRELLDGRATSRFQRLVAAALATTPLDPTPSQEAPVTVDPVDTADLRARRAAVVGPNSPLFYDEPLHFVRGEGAWLVDAAGRRYLDAYNNVPTVGHSNPRVVEAMARQAAILNIHTRYLDEHLVEYATRLTATFRDGLDRVELTNSGSEANDLALRIARHATGATGILVSDFSYHGNTQALVALTTGLPVSESLGAHVRPIRVPDALDGDPEAARERSFAEIDAAIASLQADGHGLSAILLDPIFSTEGLPVLPEGWVEGVVDRVHAAGGLVISDEVQAGFARLGGSMWGHEAIGLRADLVTLGKPMGNGHPMGGVVLDAARHDAFTEADLYFNTFAGTPVSSVVGIAVLDELAAMDATAKVAADGEIARARLTEIAAAHPIVGSARGSGLFVGVDLVDADGNPDAAAAKRVVEGMVAAGVLLSRVGRADNVLKIRPPLVIDRDELEQLLDTLDRVIGEVAGE